MTRVRPGVFRYLSLTLFLSFLFYGIAILLSLTGEGPAVRVFHYLGGLMPLTVVLVWLYRRGSRAEQQDYWRRAVDFRRIGLLEYLVIFLSPPALMALSVLFDRLLSGSGAARERPAEFLLDPLAIIPFALFLLFFGPVPEELAWRGYALDRLQANRGPLSASLILGAFWAAWHLPLFFIAGTYQRGLGLGTPAFWLFLLALVPQTFLMTWLFNRTQRSTLSAILFHFAVNFSGELVALSMRAEAFYVLFWHLAAAAIATGWLRNRDRAKVSNPASPGA